MIILWSKENPLFGLYLHSTCEVETCINHEYNWTHITHLKTDTPHMPIWHHIFYMCEFLPAAKDNNRTGRGSELLLQLSDHDSVVSQGLLHCQQANLWDVEGLLAEREGFAIVSLSEESFKLSQAFEATACNVNCSACIVLLSASVTSWFIWCAAIE